MLTTTYMVFIVIVVLAGQAVLWAWAGWELRKLLTWWPIMRPSESEREQITKQLMESKTGGRSSF